MKNLISLLMVTTIGLTVPSIGFIHEKNSNIKKEDNNVKIKNNISDNNNLILRKIEKMFTNIDNFLFDQNNNCWLWGDSLNFIPANSFSVQLIPSISKITNVQFDSQGNCWASTIYNNLFRISPSTLLPIQIRGLTNITNVQLDSQGNCWIINNNDLYFVAVGSTEAILVKEVSNVTLFNLDFQGNCWVSSNNGLYFVAVGSTDAIQVLGITDMVYSINFDSQGNCYIGASHWYYISVGTVTATEIKNLTYSESIYHIYFDQQDNAWLESSDTLWFISNASANAVQIQGINNINVIQINQQGDCWVNTNNGLYFVAVGSTDAIQIQDISTISNMEIDSQGDCWAYDTNNVYFISKNSNKAIKIQGLSNGITKIQFNSQGDCWVSTTSGLYFVSASSSSVIQIQGISNVIDIQLDSQDNCLVTSWTINKINMLYRIAADSKTITSLQMYANDKNIFLKIDNQGMIWENIPGIGFFAIQTYNQWLKFNIKLSTQEDKNLVWLKPEQIASNGIVELYSTNQEINTIKVDDVLIPKIDQYWDFNINNLKDNNHSYNIEFNIAVQETNYIINFTLSSLLNKPTLNVEQLASNGTILKPIWFQKNPNNDLKYPTIINEAFIATSTINLSLSNPTTDTSESAIIYGLNADFTKTAQPPIIMNGADSKELIGHELDAVNGLFEVDVKDDAGNNFTYYLQINAKPTISNFFDTDQGQYFVDWATKNGYTNEDLNDLQKADDSNTFNTIIENSKNWVPLATFQEYADKLENMLANLKIKNSQTGLTQFDLRQAISSQIASTLDIQGEDTTAFDKSSVTITIAPPKNGKTYQDNEKVTYSIDYNGRIATKTSSIVLDPYGAPASSSVSKYLWLIILLSCIVGFGLIFLLVYSLWLKKIIAKNKSIKN